MLNKQELFTMCESYEKYGSDLRHDLHKYPETAWFEFRTTWRLATILDEHNIPYLIGSKTANKEFAYGFPAQDEIDFHIKRAIEQGACPKYIEKMEGITGLTAIIDTGKEGPVTSLRFDIDCNDVKECALEDHIPFKEGFSSVNPMFMHACGHDGHAVMGIITTLVLNTIKDKLCGKILVNFQAAEEGVRGALAVIKAGVFDDTDYFLSGHIGLSETNKLAVATNTSGFLATTKFDVEFFGTPTHSGISPEKGKNALLAAATASIALHNMSQDGRGAGRVNVGKSMAGSGRNVVPDYAKICAETRGYTTDINDSIYEKAMNAIKGSAQIYDVDCKESIVGSAQSTESSQDLRAQMEQAIREHLCEPVTEVQNLGGSEDVTLMMNYVKERGGKALHMFLNTETKGSAHNSQFDFNENIMVFGAKVYTLCVSELNKIK